MASPATKKKPAKKAAAKKVAKKATPAKKTKMTPDELRAEEKSLRDKYNGKGTFIKQDIVKDSIADVGAAKDLAGRTVPPKYRKMVKRTLVIKCQWKGCSEERRIATSDLNQVRFCEEHTLEHRRQRRRELRKAASAAKAK